MRPEVRAWTRQNLSDNQGTQEPLEVQGGGRKSTSCTKDKQTGQIARHYLFIYLLISSSASVWEIKAEVMEPTCLDGFIEGR